MPVSILELLLFGRLGLEDKTNFKKDKKGTLGTEGNGAAFSMLPA